MPAESRPSRIGVARNIAIRCAPLVLALSLAGEGGVKKHIVDPELVENRPAIPPVIIDIGPEDPPSWMHTSNPVDNTKLVMQVARERISFEKLWDSLFHNPSNGSEKQSSPAAPSSMPTLSEIKETIANGGLGSIEAHGRDVAQVMRKLGSRNGDEVTVEMLALQHIVSPADIEPVRSSSGDEGVRFTIRPEAVINALAELGAEPRVVNMSFMMGQNARYKRVQVDGSTSYYISPAYRGPCGEDYLRDLLTVAHAFPEHQFVAAAGNSGEDIATLREGLQDYWATNVLLVGEWTDDGPHKGMRGADVYVPNSLYGIGPGSSFSTAVVAEMIAQRVRAGMTPRESGASLVGALCSRTVVPQSVPETPYEARVLLNENLYSREAHLAGEGMNFE